MNNNLNNYFNELPDIANKFGGPSKFFHEKALECCKSDFLGDRHLEYIYATLVSWGMHRLGDTGPKMPDFDVFKASIIAERDFFIKHRYDRVENLSKSDFDKLLEELTDICFKLQTSLTKSKVVSASKTLAHILPDLVCPMDRTYTAKYFKRTINNSSDEKDFFKSVMESLWNFCHDKTNVAKMNKYINSCFCESYPKIFDNLIIAAVTSDQKSKIKK